MIKTAIIFGGSGYIGSKMISVFIDKTIFDKIVIADIVSPNEKLLSKDVTYKNIDVREKIRIPINDYHKEESWIFNFAAIHREPGHDYEEYFDTNIAGANNINEFARNSEIKNIFFTSSIAPYGSSLEQRTEKSNLYPETAYGISKALVEKIHEKWLAEENTRRLIIVRPGVIFGPKDPGNVFRMLKSLKRGTFILPNGGDIIKAYGYIYGLVESMLFTMEKKDTLIVYNYAEYPVVSLKEMVKIAKKELNFNRPTLKLSVRWLVIIAYLIQIGNKLLGKKSDIHPIRVKKAGFPTNIKPQYLINNGFNFKFNFKSALKHWKNVSPDDFN